MVVASLKLLYGHRDDHVLDSHGLAVEESAPDASLLELVDLDLLRLVLEEVSLRQVAVAVPCGPLTQLFEANHIFRPESAVLEGGDDFQWYGLILAPFVQSRHH